MKSHFPSPVPELVENAPRIVLLLIRILYFDSDISGPSNPPTPILFIDRASDFFRFVLSGFPRLVKLAEANDLGSVTGSASCRQIGKWLFRVRIESTFLTTIGNGEIIGNVWNTRILARNCKSGT